HRARRPPRTAAAGPGRGPGGGRGEGRGSRPARRPASPGAGRSRSFIPPRPPAHLLWRSSRLLPLPLPHSLPVFPVMKRPWVDTGFYTNHAYFQERGYNVSVILAPRATAKTEDGHGHGTAECANIFAVAPDVTFIGVKLRNETHPATGATLAEGFKVAV